MDILSQVPRTRPHASAAREPLAYALGTGAKVAALRVLAGTGDAITQRDVARRAGVQHRSIQLAINELVALGIVNRQEGGRDYLVRLNATHHLNATLKALFATEAGHFLELRRLLTESAHSMARRTQLVSLVLFGSVARSMDDPASDYDLLVVARTQTGVDDTLAALDVCGDQLHKSHGARIRPIGYTLRDAASLWRQKRAPFSGIRLDALVLFGQRLEVALNDKA